MHRRRASLSFLLAAAVAVAQDTPRPAKEILRDFARVAMPSFSDGADAESVRRFRQAIDDGCRRKAELAAELQRSHPEHERLPELLAIRWAGMTNALGEADAVLTEVTPLLKSDALRDDLRREALRALARARIASAACTNLERLDAVTDLIELGDKDYAFAASCLLDLVEQHVVDPATQRMLLDLAVEQWPDKPYGGRPAKRWLQLIDRIGRPFADELPAAQRPWFVDHTRDAAEFTVVQVWTGWPHTGDGGKDPEIEALRALRRDFGARVRLLGLLNGDLAERLPAATEAGVDWPQIELPDPEPMACPFGAPRVGFYFVLDRDGRIAGIAGRAALLRQRIDQIGRSASR